MIEQMVGNHNLTQFAFENEIGTKREAVSLARALSRLPIQAALGFLEQMSGGNRAWVEIFLPDGLYLNWLLHDVSKDNT